MVRVNTPKSRPSRRAAAGRPRNPAVTRSALVAAAAGLFTDPGYFATDTNAIARAAGYAPASFYKHFSDKTEVLLAVYADYVAQEWMGLQNALSQPGNTRERLRSALAFILGFHQAWSALRTGIRAVARIEPTVAKALKSSREAQVELLSAATGLPVDGHKADLLVILGIVEKLAETASDAESGTPPVSTEEVLAATERALLPLLKSSRLKA